MKKQIQRVRSRRTAFYPLAETKLNLSLKNEFLEKRKKGMSAKLWWLRARVKQLIKDLYPTAVNFKYSDHWMRSLVKRFTVRRK